MIAASDHGQISTGSVEPLFDAAVAAGFSLSATKEIGEAALTATGGISGEIRLRDPADRATLARIAAWLMEQPAIGHVLSADRNGVEGQVEGTLSLGLMGAGHARQPELMFILKSGLEADPYGLPGLGAMTPGDVPLGGGMHGIAGIGTASGGG